MYYKQVKCVSPKGLNNEEYVEWVVFVLGQYEKDGYEINTYDMKKSSPETRELTITLGYKSREEYRRQIEEMQKQLIEMSRKIDVLTELLEESENNG